jgi:hypothetical protein
VSFAGNRSATTFPVNEYEFDLNLSAEAYLDYYRGLVKTVLVRCSTGQTVQFPAALLQRFVSPDGVHGRFRLSCDEQFKRPRLQRVSLVA